MAHKMGWKFLLRGVYEMSCTVAICHSYAGPLAIKSICLNNHLILQYFPVEPLMKFLLQYTVSDMDLYLPVYVYVSYYYYFKFNSIHMLTDAQGSKIECISREMVVCCRILKKSVMKIVYSHIKKIFYLGEPKFCCI